MTPYQEGHLLFKQPGFFTVTPAPLVEVGKPDFSPTAMWTPAGRGCNATTDRIEVVATSIGLDWGASTPEGFVFVAPGNVAALSLSVTRGTVGSPGGAIACEAGGNGAAADLFSYVLRGSSLVDPALIGVTKRSTDSSEISLPVSAGGPDVDAIDHFAALYELPIPLPLPKDPTVYFSVSRAETSSGRIPASWWLQGAAPTKPSGASVLKTTWSSATRTWSCPEVWRSYAEIGLSVDEDIDAVAVDLMHGFMLFSTTSAPVVRDPILFQDLNADQAVIVVYRYRDGTAVATDVGVPGGTGEVDAICSLDPGGNPLRGGNDLLGRAYGVPLFPVVPSAPAHAAVAFRTRMQQQDVLRLVSVGGPRPGVGVLFFAPPPPLHDVLFWFNPVGFPAGVGGQPFQGQPTIVNFQVPPSSQGLALTLHWVEIGLQNQATLAPPVLVRL
jgi:hypothetical protein